MKLTKNVITQEEAEKVSKDFVAFATKSDYKALDRILPLFGTLKRGQEALVYEDGKFVKVKISSIRPPSHPEADGPTVRVTNGEYSWRVDGCGYAVPWKS